MAEELTIRTSATGWLEQLAVAYREQREVLLITGGHQAVGILTHRKPRWLRLPGSVFVFPGTSSR